MSADSPERPLTVGLTGGIASGKSTVADLFAERGVPVIDTDRIAHELVEPGRPALEEIVAAFGATVLDEKGRLDRRAMRELVFADPARRRRLEAILHPRVLDEMWQQASRVTEPYCLLVVPLLVETGLHREVDRVLVVDVPVETQRDRLRRRDGTGEEQIEAMLASQVDREERLRGADDVIDNSGPLEALAPQVGRLHERYLVLAGDRRPS